MKTKAIIASVVLMLVLGACSGSADSTPVESPAPSDSAVPTIVEKRVGIEIGDIAPNILLFSEDGQHAMLADFRGKVIMLNFWASWCGPCREEMPSMEKMWLEYQDRDFVIIAVSVGESPDAVNDFVSELGLTFPIYLDTSKSSYAVYNKSNGIPQTYIIDKDGVIRNYIPGSRDWDDIMQRAPILRLMGR
ncbi:MAG: TlpA disulfide reductase family protein [Candidatus Spechtbacterales bacterium]